MSANKIYKELGYKSPATVYHVLNGYNNLGPDMINRIIKKFPFISYAYLKDGIGEPILQDESDRIVQQNLFALKGEAPPPTKRTDMGSTMLNNSINRLNSLIEVLIAEIQELNQTIKK